MLIVFVVFFKKKKWLTLLGLYEHFTSILEISGNFAVRVFNVNARMCTIKKMAELAPEGFLETEIFRNAHTDTRVQQ